MRCLPLLALLLAACGDPAPELEPPTSKYERGVEPAPAPEPEPAILPYAATDFLREPPEGWVDLRAHIPTLRTDIRYHTADNFTGAPLPGYGAPGAWLLKEPADALKKVQADLEAEGLGLLVYDAYRPRRGTLGMVAWAERSDQEHLLDNGYIARLSGHNRGNTIDLTLVDLATGEPLDMGTAWDTLSEASHTKNAEGTALANRLKLKAAMEAHGWGYYHKEWWHFSYELQPRPAHRDVPYACFEPEEGAWTGPAGWEQPGYAMPKAVAFASCEGMDPARIAAMGGDMHIDPPQGVQVLLDEAPADADFELVGEPMQVQLTADPTAEGALSLAQIDATIAAHPAAIGDCIGGEDAQEMPRIMVVKLTIGPDGKVRAVEAAPNQEGRCVAEAMRALAFPTAEGETVAKWFLEY